MSTMKYQQAIAFLLLLLPLAFSPLASAGNKPAKAIAKLMIPEDFDVLYVDGEKFPKKVFVSGDTTLSLTPGEHHVVIQYNRIFEQGDAIDGVKSEPLMLTTTLAANVQYHLQYPPLKTVKDAKVFAKDPQVTLLAMDNDQAPHPVDMTIAKQLEKKAWLDRFVKKASAPEDDLPVAVSDLPNADGTYPAKAKKPNASNSSGVETTLSDAAFQLRYWWKKATEKERQDFLKEVNP